MYKFPEDFLFQLINEEFKNLKSQIAISSSGWGGRRKLPLVHKKTMGIGVLTSLIYLIIIQ